ncbi:MAG: class I SAM-dependent methyltransferase [Gammaproteobacteria bacterium]|nr:class I SAM-dependent methyltransferase [Gammaproteobacteria bacterium]
MKETLVRSCKAVLRTVLPKSMVQRLALMAERRALARLPTAVVDSRHLRAQSSLDINRLMRDSTTDAAWNDVVGTLNELLPDDVYGGVNIGDRRALYYLVLGLNVRNLLEVGTHIGASAIHLASALRDSGQANVHLTTVDIRDVNASVGSPWREQGLDAPPSVMVERLGCAGLVTFYVATASSFLATTEQHFDFIFLDGSHAAADVYREIPLALQRLAPGGVIVLHDFFPGLAPLWTGGELIAGPWLAVERLRQEGARITALPLGALPWPTKLGSTVTSLAVLLRN